ncbi:MAG: dimethylarginine dimethylaminohydrolase family protein [Chloroflexia bacterium]
MPAYVTSGYGKLRRVLLCEPRYFRFMPSNETAKAYLARGETVDLERARREHAAFARALSEAGAEVVWVDPQEDLPYQVFTRDLGTVTAAGALLGRLRWDFRKREIEVARPQIERYVPIWKEMPADEEAVFEGGDFMYLDDRRAAVGIGARTTESGAQCVKAFLQELDVEVIPVPFDPRYCHLDMVFNVVAERVCVACPQTLPDSFLARLRAERWQIVETTPDDVLNLLGNLFAVDNGVVVSPQHNARVNQALRALGIRVIEVELEELLKGGGGPHCMTYPLLRDPL